MRSLIVSIFGTYTPVTYSANGVDIIPDGLAGCDWTYIAGVVLFAITLFLVLKLVGCLFK